MLHEQDAEQATFAAKITKQEMKLDPHDGARQNVLRVQASSDTAPARARIAGRGVRVLRPRGQRGRAETSVVEIQKVICIWDVPMGRLKCLNFVPTVSARWMPQPLRRAARERIYVGAPVDMAKLAPARAAALDLAAQCRRKHARMRDFAYIAKMDALGEKDRALATRLLLGSVSAVGELDRVLASLSSKRRHLEPKLRDALRLATFEILYLHTPKHVVVSQGVEMARRVSAQQPAWQIPYFDVSPPTYLHALTRAYVRLHAVMMSVFRRLVTCERAAGLALSKTRCLNGRVRCNFFTASRT